MKTAVSIPDTAKRAFVGSDPATSTEVEVVSTAAAEVNKLHEFIVGSAADALNNAVKIGKLLADEKSKIKHGDWLDWCQSNLKFSLMTVSRYMTLSEAYEAGLLNDPKPETLSDAYKAIKRLKDRDNASKSAPKKKADIIDKMERLFLKASNSERRGYLERPTTVKEPMKNNVQSSNGNTRTDGKVILSIDFVF